MPTDYNVYGNEDGEQWFATGHLTVEEMVTAAMRWEEEVADPIDREDFNLASHQNYYVVPDPADEERYLIVEADYPNAEPMTTIRRQ